MASMKWYLVSAGRTRAGEWRSLFDDGPPSLFLRSVYKSPNRATLVDYEIQLTPTDILTIGSQHGCDPLEFGRNWALVNARNPKEALTAITAKAPSVFQWMTEVHALVQAARTPNNEVRSVNKRQSSASSPSS